MIRVSLPGLELSNDAGESETFLVDTDGWYDSVEPRLDVVDYEFGSGAYDQDPVYDEGRSITIAGHLTTWTPSPTAVFELQERVMRLKSMGAFPITVTDPRGALTATVRVSGRIDYTIIDEDGEATFEIPLFAADPRKYGPEIVQTTGLKATAGGLSFPLGSPRVDPFFPSEDLFPSDTLFPSGDIS